MDLNRVLLLFFFLAVPEAALADDAYVTCMHNTTEGTTLSSTFKHNLNLALSNLTALSSHGTKYASNSTGSGDDIVYASFECTDDQTLELCTKCVANATARLPDRDCPNSIGARIELDSCYLQYDNQFVISLFLEPAHGGSKIRIIVICGIVGATIAIVALCIILVRRYKAKQIRGLRWSKEGASLPRSLLESKAKMFLLQELKDATMNFHPNNKLGQGGFGPVYKGTLLDGEQVAIKKLAIGSQQGKREFLNEVNLITSVQHKNLVRLLGSCVEGNERILVYEYLPNGSLDFLLFGEREGGRTLDWSTRFQIVLGMAKGLTYLHEESHVRIIHRDIKPSNILLDDELNPVIADFGLARLIQNDESQINTRIAGTIGYLAPEYAMHGDFSAKIDVFSFGLVSLEIVSGKKNINGRLLPQVWQLYVQNKVLDLVDTKLDNSFTQEEAIRIIHVALLCTQDNPKARPTMSTATLWLLGRSEILQTPKKPAFVDLSEIREYASAMDYQLGTNISSNEFSHISGGKQSISKIDPR